MPSELPAIWAVRKRMQRWFVLPNFAGYSQVLRLFPPFVPFAPQNAYRSGAGIMTGVNFACPFGVAGLVAFALQLTAEVAEFEDAPAVAVSCKHAVCFWGVAHGLVVVL